LCCVVRWRVSSEMVFVDTVRGGASERERVSGLEGEQGERNAGEEGEKTLQQPRRERERVREGGGGEKETEIAIKYITGEK